MKHAEKLLVIRDLIKKLSIASIENETIAEPPETTVLTQRQLAAELLKGTTKEVYINWTAAGYPSLYTEAQWLYLLDGLPARIRLDIETVKLRTSYVKTETGEWLVEQIVDLELGRRLVIKLLNNGFVETDHTPKIVRGQMPNWMSKGKFEQLYSEAIVSLRTASLYEAEPEEE